MKLFGNIFGKTTAAKLLDDYPNKSAVHYGKTFNDWRKLRGYKLEKFSVPDASLSGYCSDCGWPDKAKWQEINKLPSNFRLDTHEYTLWLKFIGVLDPDRSPELSVAVADYVKSLRAKK